MTTLKDTTALILAGGLGTRLRAVVSDRSKVVAQVNGAPFLHVLLHQLQASGLTRVLLCTGYKGDAVRAQLGERFGTLELRYSQEPEPLGTGGALRLATQEIDSSTVLVMNGDSYCGVELPAFFQWYQARQASAAACLVHVDDATRFGRVSVAEDGRIQRFEEKSGAPGAAWVNAGVYLVERGRLEAIPSAAPVSLEKDVFPLWVTQGFYGFQCRAPFIDIGTPETYAQAQRFFERHGRTNDTAARPQE